MAYYSGTAANFTDLQTAIEDAAIANGYTRTNGILSKDSCYFRLDVVSHTLSSVSYPGLSLRGGTSQSGSSLNGQPTAQYTNDNAVKVSSSFDNPISFPVDYEIFTFTNPDEVYCVFKYNVDYYQMLAFGKSDVAGIGGTGAWFNASMNLLNVPTSTSNNYRAQTLKTDCYADGLGISSFNSNAGLGSPLFFSSTSANTRLASGFIHFDLDSLVGWRTLNNYNQASTGLQGSSWAAGLLTSLPSPFNSATVLIPIKLINLRATTSTHTIVGNLKNSRYLRIDNLDVGDIITYGSEQWKIYPVLRKNSALRDGPSTADFHSGTFGYAIKYEGA
jgi:hypothetical protein